MTAADDKRGRDLAELARQFMLWLRSNEVPGVPGLKGTPVSHFQLYAGIYRQMERTKSKLFDQRLVPNLWSGEPAEQNRFVKLRLGVSYVLLVNNLDDLVTLPDGREVQRNRIVPVDGKPLEQDGALITVEPRLDSLEADDATLGLVRNYDFTAILRRTDLVYDDAATARQARFQYPFILAYDTPRRAYLANVQDLLVPAELDPGPVNNRAEILAKRVRAFREYLYHFATYQNRELVRERGGDYYEKWLSKDSRKRQFRPTQLTDTYLKQCFTEHVMKQGDDLLLLDLTGIGRRLFRLIWEEPKRTAASPMVFTVQPLVTIGATSDAPAPAQRRRGDDDDAGDSGVRFPITAVFFHALEGADHLPTVLSFGNLDYRGGPTKRFVVDYRAFLRWYFNDARLDLGTDREWFEKFVEVFFGDQSYSVELEMIRAEVNREDLFLAALRGEAGEATGPIKKRLTEMVAWCEANPNRYFFTQGMQQGTEDKPREFIGISQGQVFEWHPDREIVTRIELGEWLDDIHKGAIFADVARSTAGMLPFINLITWGGVIVASGGVLGVGASLGSLARTAVPELVKNQVGKVISKQAVRKARPQLIAMVVEGAMSLMPSSDHVAYQFLRGLVEGLGGGAVEHYLSEIDDRLERQVGKLPGAAANIVTKGGYRAYVIYDKVSSAAVKIAGLVKAMKTVLTEERAKIAAQQLGRLGQYAGVAFLIILFVVVYLDFVYRSNLGSGKREIDRWVKKQKESLAFMVRETGDEIVSYARELQDEIRSLRQRVSGPLAKSDEARAAVRRKDEALSRTIAGKLKRGFDEVPAVADFLQLLCEEMGIKDWDELKRLGIGELMARGFDALPKRSLASEQVHKLGAALGELIGTVMLERQIVPAGVRKKGGMIFGHPQHQVAKGALAGGTWRALWRFAIFPFQNLGDMPANLKRGLEEQSDAKKNTFTKSAHRDTSYRDLLMDLIGDEDELARRLVRLAEEAGLKEGLDRVVASAKASLNDANLLPPDLEALTKGDNPDWPSDAILFVLYTWLRLGLREILEGFRLIEDDKPYAGQFRLSQLLDIIGLDVALDDRTLATLKAAFTKAKTANP